MAIDLVSLSNELAGAVERAAASIVAVHARRGIGSSGIVWRDNLILTSSEGVRAEEGIEILLPDGSVTTARLRGRDSGTDLAVLETQTAGLRPLEFAADSALKPGQLALAVGRTGNTGPIASFGIISGVSGEWKTWRGGRIDPFVRLDISAYPTLSGGAALDTGGHLIGLVSTGLSRSSVFAVTRATVDRIAGTLVQQGFVSRGFLGAAVQPVALPAEVKTQFAQDAGIMLVGIEPEGPAAVGGLILGDVLVAANVGDALHPLPQPDALADLLERTPVGQPVKFRVLRAAVVRDLDVRIGERPSRRR
ncbi:MAG TPA: S1C family serine protease [Bryobacteraceae bacterium]|nr:S1C family serine protease [Bryobacteraceae bacterium]